MAARGNFERLKGRVGLRDPIDERGERQEGRKNYQQNLSWRGGEHSEPARGVSGRSASAVAAEGSAPVRLHPAPMTLTILFAGCAAAQGVADLAERLHTP